jgi:beta-N-acetylhexosaminidase
MSTMPTGGYAARSPDLAALALAVVQPGFEGVRAPDWVLRLIESGLGGVALFGRNIEDAEQLARLTGQLHQANPATLVAVDEEGGDVTRLEYRTGSSWPGNLALGAVDDVELTRAVAREIGSALAEVGIDLDYAPDADVNVEASNPVIGVRSFGSDAGLVARHTAAWTQGIQSAGVLACAKHFPGHGDTRVDSHLGLPEVDLGTDPTTSPALEPFRAAVGAGAAAVMSGHLRVVGLDPRPATLVPAVMTGLLRDHLGFTGLAVSDGLEMGAVAGTVGLAEGAVLAVAAGVDALCIGGGLAGPDTLDLVVDALVEAVHGGRLTEERLAEASSRVVAAAALRDTLRDSATRPPGGATAGLDAAAGALQVSGSPTLRSTSPLVLELTAASNIAVGDETVSGLVSAVRRRWADAPVEQFGPGAGPAEVVAAARAVPTERPVWLAVRDVHRFAWMADVVSAVAAVRPDVVVVDTGWPSWRPVEDLAHVVTRGGSRASGEAVVRLLSG